MQSGCRFLILIAHTLSSTKLQCHQSVREAIIPCPTTPTVIIIAATFSICGKGDSGCGMFTCRLISLGWAVLGRFFSFTDTVCCCCWCRTYSQFHSAITRTVTLVTFVTCCHVMRCHCNEMDIDSGYLECRQCRQYLVCIYPPPRAATNRCPPLG